MKTQNLRLLKRAFFLGLPLALAAGLFTAVLVVAAPQQLAKLTRLTTSSDPATRDSSAAYLSADGKLVAFHGDSDLLGEGRPDNVYEIWLYDTVAMTYTRVTSATDLNRDNFHPGLNADGTLIAFQSDADILGEGHPDNVDEIWLYDTVAKSYTRVTTATDPDRDSRKPGLNADGTRIVFHGDCDFLGEGRPDNVDEIWLYDTVAMTYTRITSATEANRDSWHPHLSADGTLVTFASDSDFLKEGIPDGLFEVWLYDTVAMTYTRVTSATDANRDSYDGSFNGDASLIAFRSDADFLHESRPDNVSEIWLYDTVAMTYTRVTSSTSIDRNSYTPALSANGRYLVFDSDADFLNEGIVDGQTEIWLHWWEWENRVYLPLVLRQSN